jgi:hypothetical protein
VAGHYQSCSVGTDGRSDRRAGDGGTGTSGELARQEEEEAAEEEEEEEEMDVFGFAVTVQNLFAHSRSLKIEQEIALCR